MVSCSDPWVWSIRMKRPLARSSSLFAPRRLLFQAPMKEINRSGVWVWWLLWEVNQLSNTTRVSHAGVDHSSYLLVFRHFAQTLFLLSRFNIIEANGLTNPFKDNRYDNLIDWFPWYDCLYKGQNARRLTGFFPKRAFRWLSRRIPIHRHWTQLHEQSIWLASSAFKTAFFAGGDHDSNWDRPVAVA